MTRTLKLFTVAGTSIKGNKTKIRFSRDLGIRTKTLVATGDTDINLIELPAEMNKLEAVRYLQAHLDFDQEHEQAAFAAFLTKDTAPAATVEDAVEDTTEDTVDF